MTQLAEPTSGGGATVAIAALAGAGRMPRLVQAYAVGSVLWTAARRARERLRADSTFTVSVYANDDIYDDLHRLLLDRLPPAKRRALIARSGSSGPYAVAPEPGRSPATTRPLRLLYDGLRPQRIDIGGHTIDVAVIRPDVSHIFSSESPAWARHLDRIQFSAASAAGRDAVLVFLQEVVDNRAISAPRLWIAGKYGNWDRRDDLPTRSLDTVVLRDGQKEEIVADLERFLGAEADYNRMGVPWHRGYLFHGPPGNGKTSLARALATRFGLDLYYLPLSDMAADADLLRLASEITPRSVLLIEDIDVAQVARERDDKDNRASMSGLLNALDGVGTPHGLVKMLTTNNPEVLDGALIRPGRADRRFEIANPDSEQIARLVWTMLGVLMDGPFSEGCSVADVVEAIKSHIDDPDAAAEAVAHVASGFAAADTSS